MSTPPDPEDLVLRFERRDGRPVRVRSIMADDGSTSIEEIKPAALPDDRPNAHSPDFASVRWNGVTYAVHGPKQRAIIAVLWQAWEAGTPFVGQEALLEEADSAGRRLVDIFRRSEAWDRLIVRGSPYGGPPGSFCLKPTSGLAV